jgi:hypothetical protein
MSALILSRGQQIDLGRFAYITYCKNVSDLRRDGTPIVSFEHLTSRVKEGWIATAMEVLRSADRFTHAAAR